MQTKIQPLSQRLSDILDFTNLDGCHLEVKMAFDRMNKAIDESGRFFSPRVRVEVCCLRNDRNLRKLVQS